LGWGCRWPHGAPAHDECDRDDANHHGQHLRSDHRSGAGWLCRSEDGQSLDVLVECAVGIVDGRRVFGEGTHGPGSPILAADHAGLFALGQLGEDQPTESCDVRAREGRSALARPTSVAEAAQNGSIPVVEKDVVGANVAVSDTAVMQVAQCSSHADHEVQQLIEFSGLAGGEGVTVHDREVELAAVPVVTDVDNLDHAGVPGVAENRRFVPDALTAVDPALLDERGRAEGQGIADPIVGGLGLRHIEKI